MPWQQYVADVALEIDPDSGEFAYDEVGLIVPRQSGKSTLILVIAALRAMSTKFYGARQKIVYTAQTRNKAREKWEEDYLPDLTGSKLSKHCHPHLGNGNEHVRFTNGSRFGIEANTEKAGHGSTLDLAFIDEAFSHADDRLEVAFGPAMITRRNKQLWWVSTVGWLGKSLYLEDKTARGRVEVEAGATSGLAYFEWSAHEDDPYDDPEVWRRCMPALGHTITEKAIWAELRKAKGKLAGFRRSYLNQWVAKDSDDDADTVVDLERWGSLATTAAAAGDRPSPVVFAVEVSPNRRWATILLAGWGSDGKRHVQVVETQKGTAGVVSRLGELRAVWKPLAIVVNPRGPAGSLLPEMQHLRPVKVSSVDEGQAVAGLRDLVEQGELAHYGQRQLDIAVSAAGTRRRGESEVLDPLDPTVDISPLRGVAYALHVLASKPRRPSKPRVVVMR